jgi:hypothetical protein
MIIFSILSGVMIATLLMVNMYIVKNSAEINDSQPLPEDDQVLSEDYVKEEEVTVQEPVVIPTTPPSIPVEPKKKKSSKKQ